MSKMANQYFRNFILWGEVDFHCLICEESFQDLAELDRHIRWENHRKLLKAQVKSHKFKKEVIYKVGELFYCEVCNFVTSAANLNGMNLHIASEMHKNNKIKPKTDTDVTNTPCKRYSDYVIVKDVIVEDKDWNCITHDNDCLVCGIRIPLIYLASHTNSLRHIINLIAARVVVDNDRFYRKLYNNTFYCLCCKEGLPMTAFESHWTTAEHCEFRNDPIFKTTYANTNAARVIEEKKRQIERGLIVKLQKDNYEILEEKETAICKQCQFVVKLDFKIMNDHQKSHKDAVDEPKVVKEAEKEESSSDEDSYEVVFRELTDHGQRRKELKEYGLLHSIRLNSGGSKGYCSICCTTVSGHLKLFKEHIRGARHKGHLELKGIKKSKVHKIPNEKFIPISDSINNLYFAERLKLLCLNREVCLDIRSFILVYAIDKRFQYKKTYCFICDVTYPYSYDFEHYGTEEHKKRFLSVKALPREGEFVREIRPDVYHCGVCNKIYPFWEMMEKHLLSKPHHDNKNVNKYKVFEQETFDDTKVKISSKYPDILYLQLLSMGIVKSKGEKSANGTCQETTNFVAQSAKAMQSTKPTTRCVKTIQVRNNGLGRNAKQVKNAGLPNVKALNVTKTAGH